MLCIKCGKEIGENRKFCPFCGTKQPEPKKTEESIPKNEEKIVREQTPDTIAQKSSIQIDNSQKEMKSQESQNKLDLLDLEKTMASVKTVKDTVANSNSVKKIGKVFKDSDTKMFADVGNKICSLAKIVCWIGIVGSAITGFVLMVYILRIGGMLGLREAGFVGILAGLIVLVVGSLLAWLGSTIFYAFGDIARRIQAIEEYLRP